MKKNRFSTKAIATVVVCVILCALVAALLITNVDVLREAFSVKSDSEPNLVETYTPEIEDEITNSDSYSQTTASDALETEYLGTSLADGAGIDISSSSDTAGGYYFAYKTMSDPLGGPTIYCVDAGKYHMLFVDVDGFVYSRGSNQYYQLGLGNSGGVGSSFSNTDTSAYINYLMPVTALNDIVATDVAAGGFHSIVIGYDYNVSFATATSDPAAYFHVYAWGRNTSGQVGNGTTSNVTTPTDITKNYNFNFNTYGYPVEVSAGEHFSMLRTSKGYIFTWGSNAYYQCVRGSVGANLTTPGLMSDGYGIFNSARSICAGSCHAVALRTNGEGWTWGANERGQCATGGTSTYEVPGCRTSGSFSYITAGELHTAVGNDTTVWFAGDRRYGKCADGYTSNSASITGWTSQANYRYASPGGGDTLAINTSGTLCVTGAMVGTFYGVSANGYLNGTSFGSVVYVDGGGSMSLIINSNHTIYIIGYMMHRNEHNTDGGDMNESYQTGSTNTSVYKSGVVAVTKDTSDYQKIVSPYNNLIGLPAAYSSRGVTSNVQNHVDKVTFYTHRVKLTFFTTNGWLKVAQLTPAQYSASSTSGATFKAVTKCAIITKEGYYCANYYLNGSWVNKFFCIANNVGPEIEPTTIANTLYPAFRAFDGYGIKSVNVTVDGTTTFSQTYDSSTVTVVSDIRVTANGSAVITVVDGANASEQYTLNCTSIPSIANAATYTKTYDGSALIVSPTFNCGYYGTMSLAQLLNNYIDETVSAVTYTKTSGALAFTTGTAAPVNTGTYTVSFKIEGGGGYSRAYSGTLTINQATPVGTASVNAITYGQELSEAGLAGTVRHATTNEVVSGAWSWPSGIPVTNPSVAKSGSYTVTFTPTSGVANGAVNYKTITNTVTLTINKATPKIEVLNAAAINYEKPLSAATLSGSCSNTYDSDLTVNGAFTWDTAKMTAVTNLNMPMVSESGSYPVIFTPTDTVNYNVVTNSNYVTSGKINATLTVNKIAQNLTLTSLTADEDVSPESIATQASGYTTWAHFETTTDKSIAITAYTTAIYPTYREISISVSDATLVSLGASTYELVTVDGITYSKVSATITTLNKIGVVEIFVNQYDSNTTVGSTGYSPKNLGNYNNGIQQSYKLYIKTTQYSTGTFSGETFTKTYGDNTFDVNPALNSEKKDYTLISSNNYIVSTSVSEINDARRTVTIHNVGTITLTLTHPGYVDPDDSSIAFRGFTETATVKVNPATLTISIDSIIITYGTAPVINYHYEGWKYEDGNSNPIPVSVTANDYDAATMYEVKREGGSPTGTIQSYTITPTAAINTGSYNNYVFAFEDSSLTINPKTVVCTIENDSKIYGDVTPDFPITYVGWEHGENESTANITTLPTVNYGMSKTNQFQDVGVYELKINGDGVSNNYNFTVSDKATLSILTSPVNIAYPNCTFDFDGQIHTQAAVITGVEGGSIPVMDDSSVSYRYSTDSGVTWTYSMPITAASYTVEINFFATANDNYESTTKYFNNALTIKTVNPTLEMQTFDVNYTSVAAQVLAVISGVSTLYEPIGTATYYYSVAGANSYTDIAPRNVGTYDVQVNYYAGTGDNYKTYSEVFESILVIKKIDVNISLVNKVATYNADGTNPIKVTANAASVTGAGSDILPITGEGRFTYEYYVNEAFTTAAPYNAGIYAVRVTYKADADGNYNTTSAVFTTGVTINKAKLTDVTLESKVADYTGELIAPNVATYNDLFASGGSKATGTLSYAFKIVGALGNFTPARGVANANTYNVRVTYTSNSTDNYETESFEFASALIINRIAPTITFNVRGTNSYTGTSYFATAVASAGSVAGSNPIGALTYKYLIDDEWVTGGPSEAGSYTVKAIYTTIASDNYTDYEEIKANYIVIEASKVTINIINRTMDYTGEAIAIDAENPIVELRGATYDPIGPKGTLSYRFKKQTENTWSTNLPVESGIYDVNVTYTATYQDGALLLDERNYIDTDRTFLGAITINNIAPTIELVVKTVTYDGNQVYANTPTINQDSGVAYGTTTIEYLINKEWTTVMPTNAGKYDIRVIYSAAVVDNYKSYSKFFAQSLIITPLEITVTPNSNQFKTYDGLAIDGSTIAFIAPELIYGNVWTGALRAGTNSTVDLYEITQGTLSAGENYTVTFTGGVTYEIRRKEVSLIFPSIESVYDGKPKSPEITISPDSLIGNDLEKVKTEYQGDNRNVGTFTAVASLVSRNYSLPATYSNEYTITPATMTGNVFESKEEAYNGKEHQIIVSSYAVGSTISYDSPTLYTARGTYRVIATISKTNYYNEILSATLTIVKGQFDVTVLPLSDVYYYGDALPALVSNNSTNGVAALDEGQILIPGEHSYTWTFTPYDTENYNVTTGEITILVSKATANITVRGPLTQTISDPERVEAYAISGDDTFEAEVTYIGTDGTVYSSLPTTAGRYTMVAKFAGNENYGASEYTTTITIKATADLWWVWLIVAIVIAVTIASIVYFTHKKKSKIG